MNDKFPGNSIKNRPPKEKIKMVVSKPAKRKKKSFIKNISENIFEDDDGEKVSKVILDDIIIPSAKDTVSNIVVGILDTIKETFDRVLFGDYYGPVRRNSRYGGSYSSISRRKSESRNRKNSRYGVDDVEFDSREEAQDVLDVLLEQIDKYHEVTVSDFYDAAGVTSGNFTDNKYGWDTLRNAKIGRSGTKFYINLPKPIFLDD